jgi:hypothetical protein
MLVYKEQQFYRFGGITVRFIFWKDFVPQLTTIIKATAKWSGFSLITSIHQFMKPMMAEVSIPLELILDFLKT